MKREDAKPVTDSHVLLLDCDCHTKTHALRVDVDRWAKGDQWLSISAMLSPFRPWYVRIWVALCYVFGTSQSKYEFDEWMITSDSDLTQLQQLHTIIGDFLTEAMDGRRERALAKQVEGAKV